MRLLPIPNSLNLGISPQFMRLAGMQFFLCVGCASLKFRQYCRNVPRDSFLSLPIHISLTRFQIYSGQSHLACKSQLFSFNSRNRYLKHNRVFSLSPHTSASDKMTGISLVHGNLMINGRPLLSSIHQNITLTPDSGNDSFQGAFLGATASASNSRHVFPLGILNEVRYVCCFRFNLWWMTQTMGTCGREIPKETQFLLVESKNEFTQRDVSTEHQTSYCIFLPLLEGNFRSALQGNERNELEICVESGDPGVETYEALHSLYIAAGTDPFKIITDAVRAVEAHLKSFCHREKKKLPDMLNWFGWCTWDAFYTDVSAEGVKAGLKSFIAGGTPPRFLIIDDGWQSITTEKQVAGTQFARRLIDIKENYKFRKDDLDGGQHQDDHALSLQHLVQEAKDKYSLKYVYAWHSIMGYWGGVSPGAGGMVQYQCALTYPVISAGVLEHQPDLTSDALTVCGIGLVNPKQVFAFYNDLHSYLASSGIDGVKVDVQNILESLGTGHGGRVQITRQYQQALEASVARHFPDNGCIACMCHNTDGLYSSKQTAVARASEDFFPRDPASHTIHVASLAYNSLFLGEFMQPDWDMFHSLHPAAEYHAAARAVGGCGIYVSDKPGHHDFNLLKKLVLPDGSILRAELPGRPTRDCLFVDPTRDNSLLKIWNLNKHTGVLGAFNCQGAGWSKDEKINKIHHGRPQEITGSVLASDVELLQTIAHDHWNGDTIIYSHRAGELLRLPKSSALAVTLKVLQYEVFTIVPLKSFPNDVAFAPVGLHKMLNSGAAIKSLEYKNLDSESNVGLVKIKVHGCGEFGAYTSRRPESCFVDSSPAEFAYDPECGLLTFDLRFYEEGASWNVEIII